MRLPSLPCSRPSAGPLAASLAGLLAVLPLLAACGDGGSTVSSLPSGTAVPTGGVEPLPSATSVASGVPSSDVDQVVTVTYAEGRVTGGVQRVAVRRGSTVRLVVTSDVADELHLHVYDLRRGVGPGRATELVFVADVPGQVEGELEGLHRVLVRLVVS